MNQRIIQLLCWLPVLGTFFEFFHLWHYQENYMSENQDPVWFWSTAIYHAVSVGIAIYVLALVLKWNS